MKGPNLFICRGTRHVGQPVMHTQADCPLCAALERIEKFLVGQKDSQDRRCAECRKPNPVNSLEVKCG